ncbi:unnamed protein product [Zymoseptoria tritici ST99CH_1A5]|uniref:Uncharacterized protein n=1 Tax=Zymoseptoria tritici ST99CH_1A5 TaxID=1276529 RepID=A0A1Y6M427_ZYMTR|nr:unnamed protein product [Zymoseptoria tritici ST99CH_1A5]
MARLNTRKTLSLSPHSRQPPSPSALQQLISIAATSNDGKAALEAYRRLRNAQPISSVESSIAHALPPKTTEELIHHFETIYFTSHGSDRNLKTRVMWLLSDACPWQKDLHDFLGIYALFGHTGVTRKFLEAFRKLAELRSSDNHSLSLIRALQLLHRASNDRKSSRAGVRGVSHSAEWTPTDCKRASELAVAEDQMHWPGKAKGTAPSKERGSDEQEHGQKPMMHGCDGEEHGQEDGGHHGVGQEAGQVRHGRSDHEEEDGQHSIDGQDHGEEEAGQKYSGRRDSGQDNHQDEQHHSDEDEEHRGDESGARQSNGRARCSTESAPPPEQGRAHRSGHLDDRSSTSGSLSHGTWSPPAEDLDDHDVYAFGFGSEPAAWHLHSDAEILVDNTDTDTNILSFDQRHQHSLQTTAKPSSVHHTTGPSDALDLRPPEDPPSDMLHKRLRPRSPSGDGKSKHIDTTAKFWNQHRSCSQRLQLARNVMTSFCHPRDSLVTGDMLAPAANSLLEDSIAVQHNTADSLFFTVLGSVACPAPSGTRYWFVADVEMSALQATVYTRAPAEASSSISDLIAQLHSRPETLEIISKSPPNVADEVESADFISCLATATTIVAGGVPDETLLLSTPLWTTAFQACLVLQPQRRCSHLVEEFSLLADNELSYAYKRRKLDMPSKEQTNMQHAINAFRREMEELSAQISCIEAYVPQARHIQYCAATALEKSSPISDTLAAEVEHFQSEITNAKARMEKAESGSGQHAAAARTLHLLERELKALQPALPSQTNLPYVKTWADMVVGECERRLREKKESREGARQQMRDIVSG